MSCHLGILLPCELDPPGICQPVNTAFCVIEMNTNQPTQKAFLAVTKNNFNLITLGIVEIKSMKTTNSLAAYSVSTLTPLSG